MTDIISVENVCKLLDKASDIHHGILLLNSEINAVKAANENLKREISEKDIEIEHLNDMLNEQDTK